MTDHQQAAIEAAARAVDQARDAGTSEEMAQVAIAAAAPIIRAEERKRIAEDIRALLVEVKRLQAQIDAVKALHCQDAVQPRYCAECSDFGTDQFPAGELIEWPCPTLLAFHGDES